MFRTVIPSGVEGSGVVGARVLHHPPGSLDFARDDSDAFVILRREAPKDLFYETSRVEEILRFAQSDGASLAFLVGVW